MRRAGFVKNAFVLKAMKPFTVVAPLLLLLLGAAIRAAPPAPLAVRKSTALKEDFNATAPRVAAAAPTHFVNALPEGLFDAHSLTKGDAPFLIERMRQSGALRGPPAPSLPDSTAAGFGLGFGCGCGCGCGCLCSFLGASRVSAAAEASRANEKSGRPPAPPAGQREGGAIAVPSWYRALFAAPRPVCTHEDAGAAPPRPGRRPRGAPRECGPCALCVFLGFVLLLARALSYVEPPAYGLGPPGGGGRPSEAAVVSLEENLQKLREDSVLTETFFAAAIEIAASAVDIDQPYNPSDDDGGPRYGEPGALRPLIRQGAVAPRLPAEHRGLGVLSRPAQVVARVTPHDWPVGDPMEHCGLPVLLNAIATLDYWQNTPEGRDLAECAEALLPCCNPLQLSSGHVDIDGAKRHLVRFLDALSRVQAEKHKAWRCSRLASRLGM